MTKCKLIFILTGLLFPLVLGAQYTDFDLSKYKLPDIRLHRLDASFDFSNAGNRILSRNEVVTTRTKNNNIAGGLDLEYYYFRNTEKYQGNLNAYTNINPALSTTGTESNDTRNTSSEIDILINSTNRFYNRKLFFIEVDPTFSYYVDNSKHRVENSTTTEDIDRRVNTQLAASVSVGYGRIEPVEDLRLAIYILEELQKAGRIEAVPPEDVVIEMAREISGIKKKRFFDTRLRKIEELHVIDSFLIAHNIISSNDVTYFAVLNDNWEYASGPVRETGFRINAGIDNGMAFSRSREKTTFNGTVIFDDKNYSNNYNVSGFIDVEYSKPVNLYWQTSAGLHTSYGKNFYRNPLNTDDYDSKFFRTSVNGMIQYLPNSRTTLRFRITGNHGYSYDVRTINELDPDGYRTKSNTIYVIPGFDMYYYISPRLRLWLMASLSGNNTTNKVQLSSTSPEVEYLTRSFSNNLNMTLIYSFF